VSLIFIEAHRLKLRYHLTLLPVLGNQEGKGNTEGQGGKGSQDDTSNNGDNNCSDGSAIGITITAISGLGEGRTVGELGGIGVGGSGKAGRGVGRKALKAVGKSATGLLGASVASIDSSFSALLATSGGVGDGGFNTFTLLALVFEASGSSLTNGRTIVLGLARVAVRDLGFLAHLRSLVASPDGTGVEFGSRGSTIAVVQARSAKGVDLGVGAGTAADGANVTNDAFIGGAGIFVVAISIVLASTKTYRVGGSGSVGVHVAGIAVSSSLDENDTRHKVTARDNHVKYSLAGSDATVRDVDFVGAVEEVGKGTAKFFVDALSSGISRAGTYALGLSTVGGPVGNVAVHTVSALLESVDDTITASLCVVCVVGGYNHLIEAGARVVDNTLIVGYSRVGSQEEGASEDSAQKKLHSG
jgi:hypothetical protein